MVRCRLTSLVEQFLGTSQSNCEWSNCQQKWHCVFRTSSFLLPLMRSSQCGAEQFTEMADPLWKYIPVRIVTVLLVKITNIEQLVGKSHSRQCAAVLQATLPKQLKHFKKIKPVYCKSNVGGLQRFVFLFLFGHGFGWQMFTDEFSVPC